ncbi:hypothetical protein [Cyclobacterium roseum]|uniref:hypothetical protein n=1 Tax=Cyclobacterium roseum TaxID=2666137 RepID=UPI0013918595|nr:hypothetical protein [Cyclobacterium roseum]
MDLDSDLKKDIEGLRIRINIFFWVAVGLAFISVSTFIFYAYFPGKIYNWFPANPHDYANNLSVVMASLSGVLFVYIAFLGQQWQLIYQQQEIRDNRMEMKASTAELKIQAKALTEQINKMDRDFVHQNFFRILSQHFNARDRVEYELAKLNGNGEKAFEYYLLKISLWVDDEKGWNQEKTDIEKKDFLKDNEFDWQERPRSIKNIGDGQGKFLDSPDIIDKLDKTKITFIFRSVTHEEGLGKYLRSCYYLFEYMKENALSQYLDAVEAGMDKYERIFLFYQMTTRFEGDGRLDLVAWLAGNSFCSAKTSFGSETYGMDLPHRQRSEIQ